MHGTSLPSQRHQERRSGAGCRRLSACHSTGHTPQFPHFLSARRPFRHSHHGCGPGSSMCSDTAEHSSPLGASVTLLTPLSTSGSVRPRERALNGSTFVRGASGAKRRDGVMARPRSKCAQIEFEILSAIVCCVKQRSKCSVLHPVLRLDNHSDSCLGRRPTWRSRKKSDCLYN